MIQLTKGTNVLDINLSDFSGAGQDVVQNGSFDDIGSDLVQNGDFAEIGSELVTNGDFSAVPLGSELVENNDFSNGTTDWSADGGSTISVGTHEGRTNVADINITGTATNNRISQAFSWTKNSSYKVTCDVFVVSGSFRIDTADSLYDGDFVSTDVLGSWQTLTGYITSNTTGSQDFWLRSMLDGAVGEVSEFYVDSVSIKEETNLVTNPNFTDTGSELVVNGDFLSATSWNVNSNWNINTALGVAEADGTSNADINQAVWLPVIGKSYKVTFEVVSLTQGRVLFKMGGVNGEGHTTIGIKTEYIVATSTDRLKIDSEDSFIGSVTDVSIKELGEDWTLESGWSINENGAYYDGTGGTNRNIRQDIGITDGKSYKITYNVYSILAGEVAVRFGGMAGVSEITATATGTYTGYITANGSANGDIFIEDNDNAFVGSISSIVVQELGEGWTIGDKWSLSDEGARLVSSTSDASGLSQSDVFEIGKSYKVTLDAVVNSGTAKLEKEAGAVQFLIDTTKTYVEYFTATQTSFYLNRYTSVSDIYINNISVKEVGQDWTVGNPDATHYVEFYGGVGGARYVSDTTSPILTLTANGITLLAGKHYKLIVDVTVVTGSVKYDVTGTTILYDTTEVKTSYFSPVSNTSLSFYRASSNVDVTFNSVIVQQLDTNNRWVTFADPDSKSVMKQGQVDLEIDSSGNNCGVYQTGLIKPNKLYIITINMKATAAINVEIAASLGTAVSAVIGTETLTTSYKEYSFEYVTPFAVDHDLQIHRLFGSGADQTISIDYVSMNGVDESQWTNDPTWDPFATSLVFVPTLTDESTNNSKQFTLNTSITDGGWDGRSLHGQVIINEFPTEIPAAGVINLKQPDFLEGFYQVEIRGYLGTFYRVLGKCMAHLERTSTEDGYNRFESYNDTVTYKAYEE